MKLLEGKTAIVIGASRGIGKAIAIKYTEEACNIAFTDLFEDENRKNTEAELK
jgi:3-oxoacyl-[acyl-carrier protein] reductase